MPAPKEKPKKGKIPVKQKIHPMAITSMVLGLASVGLILLSVLTTLFTFFCIIGGVCVLIFPVLGVVLGIIAIVVGKKSKREIR